MTRRASKAYIKKTYGGRDFIIKAVKNGYLQAVDKKTGKRFGRPMKRDGEAHKNLYKALPIMFDNSNKYKDFLVKDGKLVKEARRNITSEFKAKDWVDLGFPTKKYGEDFSKSLRKYGFKLHSKDDLKKMAEIFKVVNHFNIDDDKHFNKLDQYVKKISKMYKVNVGRVKTKELPTTFKKFTKSYEFSQVGKQQDIYLYTSRLKNILLRKVAVFLKVNKACKFNFTITIKFFNPTLIDEKTDEPKTKTETFYTGSYTINNNSELSGQVDEAIHFTIAKIEKYTKEGSGWVIDEIKSSYINLVKHQIVRGSSYFELNKFLYRKVINIKNDDNLCFLYSVLCGLHYKEIGKDHQRVSKYAKYLNTIEYDLNDFPLPINKVEKYEHIIKKRINVLRYINGEKEITPYRYSTANYDDGLVLLLCYDPPTKKEHYVYVPDLSRLLNGQLGAKRQQKYFFCLRCLAKRTSKEAYEEHIKVCQDKEIVKIQMAKKDLSFNGQRAQQKLPFVVYGDFECLIKKEDNNTSTHIPCGACYVIVSMFHEKPIKKFLYRGLDCVDRMREQLIKDCDEIYDQYFKHIVPYERNAQTYKMRQEATHCHICDKEFDDDDESDYKVIDHCHFTGEVRGVAHRSCNVAQQTRRVFPVVFHNLKGYDGHIIIKHLKSGCNIKDISVVPNNSEKFMSFTLQIKQEEEDRNYKINFIDSLAFLSSSLESISSTLEPTDFKQTNNFIKENFNVSPLEQSLLFRLIKRKGVYAYEHMDEWGRFEEEELPPKEAFISQLRHETRNINDLSEGDKKELDHDYKHAETVWKSFQCKNNGDYHDLYLMSDVCLLADVFERFRNVSLDKFKLDPAHFITLPSLAWSAMLKITDANLYLFKEGEEDLYYMMEKAKIGGISGTGSKRYTKANNKYVEGFEPSKPSNYIIYTDANQLYGWAQKQKLPIGEFEEIDPKDFNLEEAREDVDGDYGYFIVGDFLIPDELHDDMNDYPPFPENIIVKEEWLGNNQKELKKKLEFDENGKRINNLSPKVSKLVLNLHPKKDYTIHIKLLDLYMELGCKVENIYRIIRFRQEAWMNPFITLCAEERAKDGVSDFEKDFWKLCGNAVYGKTMENVRKRVNVDLLLEDHEDKFLRLTSNPLYTKTTEIKDGLVAVERGRATITLDKPVYVGVAVLNISKWLMYSFFYKTLRKKYPNAKMLYTDTDSFIFEVETEDFYKDLLDDKEFLEKWDLSNYDVEHKMFSSMSKTEAQSIIKKNKKVAGLFKDETEGKAISEYVGLRAKMYSVLIGDKNKNTGKGIKKQVLKTKTHNKYKDCLFKTHKESDQMTFIRSKNHNLRTETITKTTLCSYDDKRWIGESGTDQICYGHWRLRC